jgi:hypothetical protein
MHFMQVRVVIGGLPFLLMGVLREGSFEVSSLLCAILHLDFAPGSCHHEVCVLMASCEYSHTNF